MDGILAIGFMLAFLVAFGLGRLVQHYSVLAEASTHYSTRN